MVYQDYKTRYIAFLDILGFRENILKTHSCQQILDIYKNIKNPIQKIYVGDQNNKAKDIITYQEINTKVMSDSICFYINADLPNALFCLLACCGAFQSKLLSLSPPVLIRGAIVLGKLYAEGDIMFGPGFVEAYHMEEYNAKYPRIILSKSTLDQGRHATEDLLLGNFSSAVYCDSDEFYCVDWANQFEGFDTTGVLCQTLLQHITVTLDSTTSTSIREKYLYLKRQLLSWYRPPEHYAEN